MEALAPPSPPLPPPPEMSMPVDDGSLRGGHVEEEISTAKLGFISVIRALGTTRWTGMVMNG